MKEIKIKKVKERSFYIVISLFYFYLLIKMIELLDLTR